MIRFECSECGEKLRAEDRKAGSSVACPACRRPTTVPMTLEVASYGDEPRSPIATIARPRRRNWSLMALGGTRIVAALVLWGLVLVGAFFSIVLFVMFPAYAAIAVVVLAALKYLTK